MNIEHRTSNIEHRILMTLRFVDYNLIEPHHIGRQSRPWPAQPDWRRRLLQFY